MIAPNHEYSFIFMTDTVDFLIQDNGQHSITITPVNITLESGILYATGNYVLSEGNVGVGTITFNENNEWSFDGLTEISEDDINHIVQFIMKKDNIAGPDTNAGEPEIISGGGTPSEQDASEEITFIVQDKGLPVDVRVQIHYPAYDIELAGKPVAQLEQDHHSNWFVASGRLDDSLVQQIGRRIVEHLTA